MTPAVACAGVFKVGRKGGANDRARRIAVGGLFSALSLVLMAGGNLLPVATFVAPAFAGIFLVPVAIEVGTRTALISYAAISLISLFLLPDKEMALFFITLLGYYPLLQPAFMRISNRFLRQGAKLLLCNVAAAAAVLGVLFAFTSAEARAELFSGSWLFTAVTVVFGNIVFFLYDILLDRLRPLYFGRLRRLFFGRR